MAHVLIIDDDRMFCDVLSRAVNALGHQTVFALTLKEGLDMALSKTFDVVMLDVQLPDGNGIKAIPTLLDTPTPPEVIIITGSGNPDGAELSIQWGAWDYIEKPSSVEAMTLPLIRALEFRREKTDKKELITLDRNGIIGSSPKLNACLDRVAQAAMSDVKVLITGETGTGKELLARAIHKNSARAGHPYIVVDCSVIPEALAESHLFGHEKGAFTGAERDRAGLIKQASGGTLFLDEVGELSLPIQKAFLRVLQEQRFRPLGSKKEETSDFRLIAATNRNLETMIAQGTFREDLYYRLQSFVIQTPSLREHQEDIPELAMHQAMRICEETNSMSKGFSPDFFDFLSAYPWPGNVRELFNALQSAFTAAGEEPVLFPNHLPLHIRSRVARDSLRGEGEAQESHSVADPDVLPEDGSHLSYKAFRNRLLEQGERQYFTDVASRAKGSLHEACRLSGLSKSRLYFFLQKYNISLKSNPS